MAEAEQHHYELRSGSRSRSQTPSVQSRGAIAHNMPGTVAKEFELTEHHYDLRNRSRERSNTPGEVTTGRKTASRSLPASTGRTREPSIEMISEANEEIDSGLGYSIDSAFSASASTSAIISTTTTRKSERRYEKGKSKKHSAAMNGSSQKQTSPSDSSNSHNDSEQIKHVSSRKIITSDYSSEEGEREDITLPVSSASSSLSFSSPLASAPSSASRLGSAYEIYKQAGDWWNVFPKTDYTYSPASQCRYEIAPGVLAMPNMSRPSLHSPRETSFATADVPKQTASETRTQPEMQSPTVVDGSQKLFSQQYSSRERILYTGSTERDTLGMRIATRNRSQRHSSSNARACDSDAEMDDALQSTSSGTRESRSFYQQTFSRIYMAFAVWFYNLAESLKLSTTEQQSGLRDAADLNADTAWMKLWRIIDAIAQRLYFIVVRIFFFDSWLLSRMSNLRTYLQTRGSGLGWFLLLIPFFLLAGSWCLSYVLVSHGSRIFESLKETIHLGSGGPIDRPAKETLRFFGDDLSTNLDAISEKDLSQLATLLERLRNRVNELERGTIEQTERLSNVSRTLEGFLQSEPALWSKYNNKLTVLEGGLVNQDRITANPASSQDIENIRQEFESLKAHCSRLQSCCDGRNQPEIKLTSGDANYETFNTRNPDDVATLTYYDQFGRSITKKELLRSVQNAIFNDHQDQRDEQDMEKTLGDRLLSHLTDMRVREIAKDVLKVYDADKTGRVDYALESAGGLIVSTQCTQRYDQKRMAIKILGFTLYYENNNPRTVIQGHPIQPGTCWAFQGFPGYLLIKLRSLVYITGFTLEHAPKSILPNEEMKSAPRRFNVWGFTDELDPHPVLFGDYEFLDSDESLQYFAVRNTAITRPYEYVELRVHSNHGQLEYTCLYRFRVHGKPA